MSDSGTTLNVGVAKAYWGSKESKLLVSNPQFGERKIINVSVTGRGKSPSKVNNTSVMSTRHGSKKGTVWIRLIVLCKTNIDLFIS